MPGSTSKQDRLWALPALRSVLAAPSRGWADMTAGALAAVTSTGPFVKWTRNGSAYGLDWRAELRCGRPTTSSSAVKPPFARRALIRVHGRKRVVRGMAVHGEPCSRYAGNGSHACSAKSELVMLDNVGSHEEAGADSHAADGWM